MTARRLLAIAFVLVGCSSNDGSESSVSCVVFSFAGSSSCNLTLEQCTDGQKYQAHCDGTTCTCDPGGASFSQGDVCTLASKNQKSTVVSGCGWKIR